MNFFTKSHDPNNNNDNPDIAIRHDHDSITTYLPLGNHTIVCKTCNSVLGSFRIEKHTELISCIMKCETCDLHTIVVNVKSY
jgi:hypothetical protein